jgi:pimeloyl-ACP methyl ester carboxylesterase
MTDDRKGATTIVLLPGMDGSGVLFRDFTAALGANAIVVSYPPDRALGYGELEELVRKSLPTSEPFILLGESFSGPIAISLASSRLPGLQALILVCSFARLPRFLLPFRSISKLPFWRLPVWLASAALLGRFGSQSMRARLTGAMRGVSPSVWSARARAVFTVDVTPNLAQIGVPFLYLRATEDRVVSSSTSELIQQKCPAVRIVELEGPHFLLQASLARPRQQSGRSRGNAVSLFRQLSLVIDLNDVL